MKRLLTILFVFMSAYMFGQSSMGNINIPTSSTTFPLAIAPYSYEVTQVDSNITVVITGSYTTADNLRDVYSDGNYYVLSGGGASNWDKSNDTITPTTGVGVVYMADDTTTLNGSNFITAPENPSNQLTIVKIGDNAMFNNRSANSIAIGQRTGYNASGGVTTTALRNTIIGHQSGAALGSYGLNADDAVVIGYRASYQQLSAESVIVGSAAASGSTSHAKSVLLGYEASGSGNAFQTVAIGYQAGKTGGGASNIFIGHSSGFSETGSNKLYIENSNSTTPLIFGDFSADSVTIHGSFSTDNSLGEMYDAGNTTVDGTNYSTMTGWTAGQSNQTTVDFGDSAIIVNQNGTYLVNGAFSFTHASPSTLVHTSVFMNDVEQTNLECERLISTGNDNGNTGFTGMLYINDAPDTVYVRQNADNSGTIVNNHCNFNLYRIK